MTRLRHVAVIAAAHGVVAGGVVGCGSVETPRPIAAASVVIPDAATEAPVTDAGATPANDAASGEHAPTSEDKRVAKTMKRVAAARGLKALRAVPGVVLARDALIAKVKSHVDREVPPDAIRLEGLELKLLGFIAPELDYEDETFKLLDAQLAGFYEPTDGTMYMAADLDGDNADATLAHELDHALQDQHFDLKPHSKYVPGKSDEQAAFSALAEGDATSAMADVLLAQAAPGRTALDLPDDVFVEQVLASVSTGPAAKAPHVMRTSLVSPYVYGMLFVSALRRHGGWPAVDAAWANLPTTTEQILHIEKWNAHEPALPVKAPTFAALGAGWKEVDQDSNGELGIRLAFEEWMGKENAEAAAVGWGGDRTVLVEGNGAAAMGMHLRYDASAKPRSADRDAFALLARGLAASVGKPKAKTATWICIERPRFGPLAALKHDRDLVMIAGPATAAGTWASAGDCALAKKWADEIAAQRD